MIKNSLIALTFSMMACATPSQPGTTGSVASGIQVQPGREFQLSAGQEAQVQGTPVVLRFIGVSQDSRCAVDVQCVWAGNAIVRLGLTQGDGPTTETTLNTTLDPKIVVVGRYTIRLSGLKPAPHSGKPIGAGDYVATLEVISG